MKRIAIFTKDGTEQARMLRAVHEQHGEFVFEMEDGSRWAFFPLLHGLDRVAAAFREQVGKPRLEVPKVSDVVEINERTRRVMTKKWTHAGDLRLLDTGSKNNAILAMVHRHTTASKKLHRWENLLAAYEREGTWAAVAGIAIKGVIEENRNTRPNDNASDYLEPVSFRRITNAQKTTTAAALSKIWAENLRRYASRGKANAEKAKVTEGG